MLLHDNMVHNNGAHADEYFVFEGTAVYDGIMSDAYLISDFGFCFLVGAVNHSAILDIHFVPDTDGVNIAAQDGIKPHTATVAHNHVAGYRRVVSQKTVFSHYRGNSFN